MNITETSEPKNCSEFGFVREIESIDIMQWHPLPNGQGRPTQIHMLLTVRDFPGKLVFRFKGRETLDAVVDALRKHADDVFGKSK